MEKIIISKKKKKRILVPEDEAWEVGSGLPTPAYGADEWQGWGGRQAQKLKHPCSPQTTAQRWHGWGTLPSPGPNRNPLQLRLLRKGRWLSGQMLSLKP